MDPLINLKDVARQLGIKDYQARQLVRSRALRAVHPDRGFVIRVKQSELERFIREQKDVAS